MVACKGQHEKTIVEQEEMIKVTLSVDCINAYEAGDETAQMISDQGWIIEDLVVSIPQNATVNDLIFTTDLTINTLEGAFGTYISSIESLQENAVNGKGGWVYLVNGSMPAFAINLCYLKDGDKVELRYTIESGDV